MEIKTKDILKNERIKRGLTQEDIAKILNISRGAYAKYETGINTPTTENIIALAKLYNLPTDYLLGINLNKYLKQQYLEGIEIGEDIAERIKKRVRKPKAIK